VAGPAGEAGLALALVASLLLVFRAVRGGPLRTPGWLLLAGVVVAFAALEWALLTNDFSLAYVAGNHAATAPLLYTVSAAWAGVEGSMVLWLLVLGFVVWRVALRPDGELDRTAAAVLGAVFAFFALTTMAAADPFRFCLDAECAATGWLTFWSAAGPAAGTGADPLLLNHPAMAFHPPLLYAGFLALAVPFAYAVAALIRNDVTDHWLDQSHHWLLGSFVFLTVGMGVGAWWSYEVLGWGGYWGWDPVENAALLPWIAAVALLHSLPVQRRRGMLRLWNLGTALSAFCFVALATLLTRTSVVPSVHTFTRSGLGLPLLGFLVFVVAGSFGLLALRAPRLASPPRLESTLSREGALIITGSILAALAAAVLAGTLFPVVVTAFTGSIVSVGAPFFDRAAVAAGFGLLFLMGFGVMLPWRVAAPGTAWRRMAGPALAAVLAVAVVAAFGSRHSAVLLAVALVTFVVVAAGRDLASAVATRRRLSGSARAFVAVVGGDPAHWGGQLSHVGIALVAVAVIASTALTERAEITIAPTATASFSGYALTYNGVAERDEEYRQVQAAQILVQDGASSSVTLQPGFHRYPGYRLPVATPDLLRTWRGDLYLSLAGLSNRGIVLDAFYFPLLWLLWTGGIVTAAGGLWSLWARRPSRRRVRTGSAIDA
jgi:cytochrome c-type biogenesis protein CcmF